MEKTSQEISDDYVTLYPSKDAHLKFTSNNKYGVPLFIFEGYDTFGGFLSKETELKKFVLEIDEGFMDFIESCEGDNTCIARLKFEQDYNRNNANEQKINVEYIYRTPRKSLMTSEGESIKDEIADNVNTFKESEYQRLDLVKEIQGLEYQTSVYDEESEIPLLTDSELRYIKEDDKKVRDMITEKIKQLMQQIKELDPDYEFLTEEDIEEDIEECKKEDPNFEITEESLEADLREYLAFLQVLPEMMKIAQIDLDSKEVKNPEDYDFTLFEVKSQDE